jgi:hypothetical protein
MDANRVSYFEERKHNFREENNWESYLYEMIVLKWILKSQVIRALLNLDFSGQDPTVSFYEYQEYYFEPSGYMNTCLIINC